MALISVVIPVFNAEKYLQQCLDSIVRQTFQDFEVVLIDDGSTDGSYFIYSEFEKRFSNTVLIRQENKGQAAARNAGVMAASGKWISFVDADDIIHPQYLELLYNAAVNNGALISGCLLCEGTEMPNDFFAMQTPSVAVLTISEQLINEMIQNRNRIAGKHMYWTAGGKLIDKELMQRNLFAEGRIYEDNAVVFKWLCEAEIFAMCSNKLYFYYINADGTTKRKYTKKQLDWLWALRTQIEFYKKHGFGSTELLLKKKYFNEALRHYELVHQNETNEVLKLLKRDIQKFYLINAKDLFSISETINLICVLYPRLYTFLKTIKNSE